MTHVPHMGAYLHTRDALHTRYLITLTLTEYEDLCLLLRDQFCQPGADEHPAFIKYSGAERCLIRWRIHGMGVRLVFSLKSGLIITALPHHRQRGTPEHDGVFVKHQARHERAYRRRTKYRQTWE